MELRIDSFGRLFIPKHIRDAYGLQPGVAVELEVSGENFLLKPIHERPLIEIRGGVPVFTGKLVGDYENIIQESREERIQHLGGL